MLGGSKWCGVWKISTSTTRCLIMQSQYTAHRLLRFIKPAGLWLFINSRNYRNEKDKMSTVLLLSPDFCGQCSLLLKKKCVLLFSFHLSLSVSTGFLPPVSIHKTKIDLSKQGKFMVFPLETDKQFYIATPLWFLLGPFNCALCRSTVR